MKPEAGQPQPPPPPRLTRRDALKLGLAGLACCATGLWPGCGRPEARADWGGDDAIPDPQAWELWRRRGWLHEARHWRREGRTAYCELCPNGCVLDPGDRGRCRTRVNHEGILYTLAYANPCSLHVDPVEKKPLFHFLPGSRSFSLATAGCVLRCLNCQNWEISQRTPEATKDAQGPELRLRPPLPARLSYADTARLSLFPEDVPAVAQALDCASVACTYSEPIAFYEYTLDIAKACRAAGVKTILVTSAHVRERPLRELAAHLDAAHLDLKGFNDETYRKLNGGRLQPVLDAITLLKQLGVWTEVVNLVVPRHTDKREEIRRLCAWLAEHAGPDTPLHFSRCLPAYKLTNLPPTPLETLLQAREDARAAGLRHVYLGNVRGVADAETTFCPACHRPVVERDIFAVTRLDLTRGRCNHCGAPLPGVWQ
ncbi:MAG: AmmeMemoRadiSam system radical SAM enzyme [Lentisphaeria bacterium]|jgi:pyruvate formate lyase activating enzyme